MLIKDGLIVTASNLAYYKKREEMLGILTVRYDEDTHMHCTFIVNKGVVNFHGAGQPLPKLTDDQRIEVIKRLNQQFTDFETRNYFHSPGSIMFIV
jgi:hypothetical protein